MTLLNTLKSKLKNILRGIKPSKAYDLWATDYDKQSDNLLIHLDEKVFDLLITSLNIEGKTIVDIGCGTGRYWQRLLEKKPLSIIGCDVSKQMLNILSSKYPKAQTYQTDGVSLKQIADKSCDIVTCNLTVGYIKNLNAAFGEWSRILRNTGEIIITDFHPTALRNGGKRIFTHNGKLLLIKNYVHSLSKLQAVATKKNYRMVDLIEKKVDESIRHFYEERNSLNVYNQFYGTLILYGLRFKRQG